MKPQDRNVNTVCLLSQEPVALSTFDACLGLLAVILCLLMLMRVLQLMWQHCDKPQCLYIRSLHTRSLHHLCLILPQ